MTTPDSPRSNALLAALTAGAYRRLLPDLEEVTLEVHETLFKQVGRLQFAYFPTSSVITLCYALEGNGTMAKAWPVGREGVVGISLFLGGPKRDDRADVQIAGRAYRLPARALLAEFRLAGASQSLLLRYVFALVTQASQLSVCSNYHSVDQRLCRFLVRLFDRVPPGAVAITQEQIAALLGVRRVSITVAAGDLQAAGIIGYQRGMIRVLDQQLLEQRSCACAGIIRRAFAQVAA
jgi:CRP-like cAMP-binding protein